MTPMGHPHKRVRKRPYNRVYSSIYHLKEVLVGHTVRLQLLDLRIVTITVLFECFIFLLTGEILLR